MAAEEGILFLDHININHGPGTHDVLMAFYSEVLQLAIDPRRAENVEKKTGTIWFNCGINQIHSPENEGGAQVISGVIELFYPFLDKLRLRLASAPSLLSETKFSWAALFDGSIEIYCPWGNHFIAKLGEKDPRGSQPGPASECAGIPELTIYVDPAANFAGIARFYSQLFRARVLKNEEGIVQVETSPYQSLVFRKRPEDEPVLEYSGYHISIYVKDLESTFKRMDAANLVYVSPRFAKCATTIEQCREFNIFRTLDIVDPEDKSSQVILQLEHEIRGNFDDILK